MFSEKEEKDDAVVRVISLPTAYKSMKVVDELVGGIAEKYSEHTVALVGRKKSQLIPIQILLAIRGVGYYVDKNLNVFEGTAFRQFRQMLGMIEVYRKQRSSVKIKNDLILLINNSFEKSLKENEIKNVSDFLLRKNPKTLQEAVEHFGEYPKSSNSNFNDTKNIAGTLSVFLESETVSKSLEQIGNIFEGFRKDFVKSKEDIFFSEPPFEHLMDLADSYGEDFAKFLAHLDCAAKRSEEIDPREAKIELMTALRTKGREFDTVIVLDTNQGIFPNKLSVDAGRIEEERRLFYVTVTRTKKNLLMFDSGEINSKQVAPSIFISEMQLPLNAIVHEPKIETISQVLLNGLKV